jgi:hypothetical protein
MYRANSSSTWFLFNNNDLLRNVSSESVRLRGDAALAMDAEFDQQIRTVRARVHRRRCRSRPSCSGHSVSAGADVRLHRRAATVRGHRSHFPCVGEGGAIFLRLCGRGMQGCTVTHAFPPSLLQIQLDISRVFKLLSFIPASWVGTFHRASERMYTSRLEELQLRSDDIDSTDIGDVGTTGGTSEEGDIQCITQATASVIRTCITNRTPVTAP